MPGPVLKLVRARRYRPPSREWRRLTVSGWQHGPVPEPPDGLSDKSRTAWRLWFASWVAAHWWPGDVPGPQHRDPDRRTRPPQRCNRARPSRSAGMDDQLRPHAQGSAQAPLAPASNGPAEADGLGGRLAGSGLDAA